MEEGDREEYGKQFLTAPPQSVTKTTGVICIFALSGYQSPN